MSDIAVIVFVVVTFAMLVTAHVTIVFGLASREPRWRAAVALIVPPLAPYWAFRDGMRKRAILWAAAFLIYVIARIIGWS